MPETRASTRFRVARGKLRWYKVGNRGGLSMRCGKSGSAAGERSGSGQREFSASLSASEPTSK
jgi:hypothetical protein